MEQFKVSPDMHEVSVDFTAKEIPASAALFHPTVFLDGDSFCAILGPDRQSGIYGCGDTPEAAVRDWDVHLQEKINAKETNDEVGQYIQEVLAAQELKDEPFA